MNKMKKKANKAKVAAAKIYVKWAAEKERVEEERVGNRDGG